MYKSATPALTSKWLRCTAGRQVYAVCHQHTVYTYRSCDRLVVHRPGHQLMNTVVMSTWWCRWGATPLQDAYLSGDQVMCALLERAGGMKADHPAIKEKLPKQEVSLAVQCAAKAP